MNARPPSTGERKSRAQKKTDRPPTVAAMSPKEWAAAGKFASLSDRDFDSLGWSMKTTQYGPNLVDRQGGDIRLVCRASLLRPLSRWGDDARQPLVAALESEELGAWVEQLERWLADKLLGAEMSSAVKENVFGEKFLRAKLIAPARFYDHEGRVAVMPEPYTDTVGGWAPKPLNALLRVAAYTVNGKGGGSLRLLAAQP